MRNSSLQIGNSVTVGNTAARKSVGKVMGKTIERLGAESALITTSASALEMLSDKDFREQIREVVAPYSRADLAQASGRTKEGAKEWKEAERGMNGASLLNAAQRLPRVRAYVLAKLGVEIAAFDSARTLAARVEAMERLLAERGADGDDARRIASGQSEAQARDARQAFAVHEPPPFPPSDQTLDLSAQRRA